MSPRPYAHLLPAEAVLWTRFLSRHGADYQGYDYDVRVGRGRPVPAGTPEPYARDWVTLTQQRIDAVARRDGIPVLFEVTPRAGRHALGALEIYAKLYRDTFAYTGALELVLVTGAIHPDVRGVMAGMGIRVVVLPLEEGV